MKIVNDEISTKSEALEFLQRTFSNSNSPLLRLNSRYLNNRYLFDSLVYKFEIKSEEITSLFNNIFNHSSDLKNLIIQYIAYMSGYESTDDYLLENEAFMNAYIKEYSQKGINEIPNINIYTYYDFKENKLLDKPKEHQLKFNKYLIDRIYGILPKKDRLEFIILLGLPDKFRYNKTLIEDLASYIKNKTGISSRSDLYFPATAPFDLILGKAGSLSYNTHFLSYALENFMDLDAFIKGINMRLDRLDIQRLYNVLSSNKIKSIFYKRGKRNEYKEFMINLLEKML